MPCIDGINAALFAPLLFIFELRRTVDSRDLLRKISARTNKVTWVLLVDNNLGG
jgi:hypothetical protein